MGCDIHLHAEIKLDGVWYCYSSPNIQRNYELFAKMAGVRGFGPEPRGIPNDLSKVVQLSYDEWGSDAHSASWLSVDEIQKLEHWLEAEYQDRKKKYPDAPYYYPEMEWGYLFGNGFGSFNEHRSSYPKEIQDVRFVFWFDN